MSREVAFGILAAASTPILVGALVATAASCMLTSSEALRASAASAAASIRR